MNRRQSILVAMAAFALLSAAAIVRAADPKPIEKFTAFAASLGTGKTAIVDITLYRWSTDQEREKLLTTLQEFGRDKLVDALRSVRPRVGFIRMANSMGYDLYYAREHQGPDGGRRVVLATNRPVSFHELTTGTRSKDYQLTVLELHLDADGKGEGKLVPAGKISWDTKAMRIEILNYGALPVDLLQVVAKKP
jgi:hypothetical protein